jgi:ppGpp synthetase/RelA/SpoT-type nucleotidyltranferase
MIGIAGQLSTADRKRIDRLVEYYVQNRNLVETMLKQLGVAILGSPKLMAHVHSTKERVKDPIHLAEKLERKVLEAKRNKRLFRINERNLLYKINDLAGFRILHLHTRQIIPIDRELRSLFDEYRLRLLEVPRARTWDDENRDFFKGIGLKTIKSPKMYTSVHYVVESNSSTRTTCEIQVRTLAEELWGEVDHSMNYPVESKVLACREQIKVLARLTSSCSRLVDSIYETSAASATKRVSNRNRR